MTDAAAIPDGFRIPSKPIADLLSNGLPKFCALHSLVKQHTLKIFATTFSDSVQATLYTMCKTILEDQSKAAKGAWIEDVEYSLPNKHYIPIDLSFVGLKNTDEKDAEVFLPTAHPRCVPCLRFCWRMEEHALTTSLLCRAAAV